MLAFSYTQAGYIIKGTTETIIPGNLKNHTLTFDANGTPIAAGSMRTLNTPGIGRNAIVIVHSNSTTAEIFPIALVNENNADRNIEVKDFKYVSSNDTYVLCGSRGVGSSTSSFIAVIRGNLSSMQFMQYPDADKFNSIWVDNPSTINPATGYYACGSKGTFGVIAHFSPNTLQLANIFTTTENWEYHKIILNRNANQSIRFVASGKNPQNTLVGLTVFYPASSPTACYYWHQPTDPDSHCVVSENVVANDAVIVASSYKNSVTFNPVTFPLSFGMPISAYQFGLTSSLLDTYCIQDIATITAGIDIGISVAGYMIPGNSLSQHQAWYGYVKGLYPNNPMRNNNYSEGDENLYEHYKVKYNQGEVYTGGFFKGDGFTSVLFGTPQKSAIGCDHIYESEDQFIEPRTVLMFSINETGCLQSSNASRTSYRDELPFNKECSPFKGGGDTPEFAVSAPETESEIITFHDCITVKNTPQNTNYQIYTVLGQVIQIGTTSPDISIAQLSRGIYILKLENGKAFKFVK